MKKEDIIYEWLSINVNRDRLPVVQVSKEQKIIYDTICTIYSWGNDTERVYELTNGCLFTLRIKD